MVLSSFRRPLTTRAAPRSSKAARLINHSGMIHWSGPELSAKPVVRAEPLGLLAKTMGRQPWARLRGPTRSRFPLPRTNLLDRRSFPLVGRNRPQEDAANGRVAAAER